jgi:hypothetical protein
MTTVTVILAFVAMALAIYGISLIAIRYSGIRDDRRSSASGRKHLG